MYKYIIIIIIGGFLAACRNSIESYDRVDKPANIHPCYQGTIIPYNIAPLNFAIREDDQKFHIWFVAGKDSFEVVSRKNVEIPLKKWKKLLTTHRGEQMVIRIFGKQTNQWIKYPDICFTIAEEPIDSYLAYRLIEPGYVMWGKMALYQRCIENFDEWPIIKNDLLDNACMNCHSFCKNSPETMLFHVRQQHAGTLFLKDGNIKRVNTKTSEMISAGVYPRWHPNGRYVAFSTNTTRQDFHMAHTNKVEVYDRASHIVIYDTETNQIFTNSVLSSETSFATFPEWSPDGRYLYYCNAPACPMPDQYDSLRYDLVRIPFDPSSGNLGTVVDTLVRTSQTGKSVAHARVSPDHSFVVFCMSNYGTFPIWHRENDLYVLDLTNGRINNLTLANSSESDSYHSFSTNGRWLVFGSRRMDGTYTRPYICYFDEKGNAYTPFLLPQKNPAYYDLSIKSYNVPEFITGKITISPYQFEEAARGDITAAIAQ